MIVHYTSLLKDEAPMLVLSRKVGEEIVIGGNIRVVVTAVNGERVKLGFVAPSDVRVDRAEIAARVRMVEIEVSAGELVGVGG